jgi:hypothetical protein
MEKKGGLALSLIIIIVVLLVGVGIGIFYFSGNQDNSQNNIEIIEQGIEECDDVREISEREICYFDLAISEGHAVCDKINNGNGRVFGMMNTRTCYENLAIEKQDYTICNLQQTAEKNKDTCIWNYMWQTSDYSVCEEIKTVTVKDGCYSVVAARTEDTSWCSKIEMTSEKEQCFSTVDILNSQN